MPSYSAHFWFFRIEQSRVRYMGIQTSISFPVWDIHNLRFLRKSCHSPDIWAYFPLSPNSVLYLFFSGLCAALPTGPSSAGFIRYSPTTAWTYSDIFFIQDLHCLCLVILPETSQEFTAADQIPAQRDQFPFVVVAEQTVVAYPDEVLRRDMHQKPPDEFHTL